MGWFTIVENIKVHLCRERLTYGSCSCQSGRKNKRYNPCERAIAYADSAENHSYGFPAQHSLQELYDYMKTRVCRNTGCNHKRCAENRECVAFIKEQMQERKAA